MAAARLVWLKAVSLNDENFHRPVLNDCDCNYFF